MDLVGWFVDSATSYIGIICILYINMQQYYVTSWWCVEKPVSIYLCGIIIGLTPPNILYRHISLIYL